MMKQIPMLDLRSEYEYMKEGIDSAIQRCLDHQQWILGPEVKELENKIAEYIGVQHCIGVSSGTDALVLALRALAIKTKGQEYFERTDEIITTSFTFTATGDAILRAGATPVFVDIEPSTFNINPINITEYLKGADASNSKAVGIITVHLYGQACCMNEILDIAKEYNLFILEDVAQAFGGMWKNNKLGSIGACGAFSFFPSKNLGGFGDGGMVSADNAEIADIVRMLLRHGGRDKYNVDHIGYNARLDTLQASLLLARFRYVDEFNERRRKIAENYNEGLKGLQGLVLPFIIKGHVCHQYTLRVLNGKRDDFQKYLKEKNIGTMVYYPVPLHGMKVFEGRCKKSASLHECEKAVSEVLSLPIEPLMPKEQVEYVVDSVKEFFQR